MARVCLDCGMDISDRGSRATRCVGCQKKYRAAKQRERQANESQDERAKRLEYQKEYRGREGNQERRRSYERDYWKIPENKRRRDERREDYDREYRTRYWRDNKERLTTQHLDWVARNKLQIQAYQMRYRANPDNKERERIRRARPEYKEKQRVRRTTLEYREWRRKYDLARRDNPEYREWRREYEREYRKRPEPRMKRLAYLREYEKRPEVKERQRERRRDYNRAYRLRPQARARELERHLKRQSDPEYRLRQRERNRDRQSSPDYKARMQAHRSTPQYKNCMREYLKKYRKEYDKRPEVIIRNREKWRGRYYSVGSGYRKHIPFLFNRDGFFCGVCTAPIHNPWDGTSFHVDHIIPASKGGKDDLENLRIICRTCNLRKHNKLPL